MHPYRMQLPIGFGGSCEDYWPYDAPWHYHRYPHPQHNPHRHPQQSSPRYPQHSQHRRYADPPYEPYNTNYTLSQQVDTVRNELCISAALPISEAISQANDIMGMESTGTLACQLERLMVQLTR